ncbi:MAG: glycosyltransferase family 39 protein [Cyanobacteria bacterium P01_F01_bin.116]
MKFIRFICISLIVIGVVFRIVNLNQKIYTVDEVRGLLRASGYTSQEFITEVAARDITTAQTLQQYQLPTGQRNFGDALNAFKGNPEHPPLYYVLTRFAMQLTGTSVAGRGLAALLGMLTLATMYWLCYELFQSSDIAWIGTAVMAISPFHVMLASEARQYTLWALLATGSSALLFSCLKHNRLKGWLAYGLTLVLGLYTHLFFIWIMISHGLYVVCLERAVLRRYVIVSMLSGLAFMPWVWVIMTNLERLETTTKWASQYNTDLITRLGFWLNNICIGFVDFRWSVSLKNPIVYLVCALVLICIYLLCKYTPRRVWLFVLLLTGVTAMGQIVPDLVLGGRRSLLPRYGLTSYVGLQMAVAYGIYHSWRWLRRGSVQLTLPTLGLTVMVLGGIISCGLTSQSLDWGKGSSGLNLAIAPIINQAQSPIIIGDEETYMLSLSYLVKPDVEFKLLNDLTAAPEAVPAKDVRERFLYVPSNELLEIVSQAWQLKSLVDDTPWFGKRPILYQLLIQ